MTPPNHQPTATTTTSSTKALRTTTRISDQGGSQSTTQGETGEWSDAQPEHESGE
jgi:hypothetical protein